MGKSVMKKVATTTTQYELLIKEMEKHPDVANGTTNLGCSKEQIKSVWFATAKLLNAIGPPFRTPTKWRKVWTDYRGRLRKKISNKANFQHEIFGGLSEYSELEPMEQPIDNIDNSSAATSPRGNCFGLKTEILSSPSEPPSQQLQSETVIKQEFVKTETPERTPITSKKLITNTKKRRQDVKADERKKLIKLAEDQIENMSKMTIALEKLTAAIETQTKIIEKKFK